MFWKNLSTQWERALFSAFGIVFLGYSTLLVWREQFVDAGVVFGFGFLSFVYANVSRFKRFKGFGFEAELWEDKQKEAEELINKLRTVVSIYSHEVILGKIKLGRLGVSDRWKECWQLYEKLVNEHASLGQEVDFTDLKKEMDDYFLFDMTHPHSDIIRLSISGGKQKARDQIKNEFGNPIRDSHGYQRRSAQLNAIKSKIDDQFSISKHSDLAGKTLELWFTSKDALSQHFSVEISVDDKVIERLKAISNLYQTRPVQVTDKLISWADRPKD